MAFEMSLPRTKRVKYINADGSEVFQEEDSWALVRAIHQTEQEDAEPKENEAKTSGANQEAKLPIEALEKLQVARGEVCIMLDLIEMLEAQKHMTIENVDPQKSTLAQLTRDRDLGLQIKSQQIQDVTERLQKSIKGLEAHLELQNKFFALIEKMTEVWNIRPNPRFETGGSAAPFIADLNVPGMKVPEEAVSQIELGRSSTGQVEVRGQDSRLVSGPNAVDSALSAWQDQLVWSGLQLTLNQEAQESARPSAAQTLATEILQACTESSSPTMKELKFLLIKAYLQALEAQQKTGVMPKCLPRVNAWLRHRWFSQHVRRSIQRQVNDWIQKHEEQITLNELKIPGALRSALQVQLRDQIVTLIIQADTLEVRGLGTQLLRGNRSASSSVLANVAKADVNSLLQKIVNAL